MENTKILRCKNPNEKPELKIKKKKTLTLQKKINNKSELKLKKVKNSGP